jgi:hypothetical protein
MPLSWRRFVGANVEKYGSKVSKECSCDDRRQYRRGGLHYRRVFSGGNLSKPKMAESSEISTARGVSESGVDAPRVLSYSYNGSGSKIKKDLSNGTLEESIIEEVAFVGKLPTFDIEVYPYRNYILQGGFISHNTIWGFMGSKYKLEQVAQRHLGIDHESMKSKMDAERLWASFVGDKKELREYNVMDAKIVVMLDDLLKLSEPYIDIAQQFPIMLRDAPLMSMVLETILLKETAKSTPRLVFPNREHKTANLIGGFTMQPKPGVHRGVLSLDYKSLYPTTMATFKLSPELVMLYKSWKDSGLDFNQWVERTFRR